MTRGTGLFRPPSALVCECVSRPASVACAVNVWPVCVGWWARARRDRILRPASVIFSLAVERGLLSRLRLQVSDPSHGRNRLMHASAASVPQHHLPGSGAGAVGLLDHLAQLRPILSLALAELLLRSPLVGRPPPSTRSQGSCQQCGSQASRTHTAQRREVRRRVLKSTPRAPGHGLRSPVAVFVLRGLRC